MLQKVDPMLWRDFGILIWVFLCVFPWVAHAGEMTGPVGQGVTIGELGSISWPAAVAWLAYLLRQWEPRIHVVHEKGE
jgi:hypothetical protein